MTIIALASVVLATTVSPPTTIGDAVVTCEEAQFADVDGSGTNGFFLLDDGHSVATRTLRPSTSPRGPGRVAPVPMCRRRARAARVAGGADGAAIGGQLDHHRPVHDHVGAGRRRDLAVPHLRRGGRRRTNRLTVSPDRHGAIWAGIVRRLTGRRQTRSSAAPQRCRPIRAAQPSARRP